MISYAQNAEDVVLARALPWAEGFYVDVGAADPMIASVTKHFYDHGWRGINIDPREASVRALREMRPRDINLEVAAGDADGTIDLFVCVEDPDLSTTSLSDRAFLEEQGFHFQTREVPLLRLDEILESHGVTAIDFLKIDVEGGEAQVLAGLDLAKWHPRVIVVEAVRPWSNIPTDSEWNSILFQAGYREGGFDGINRFFAREDDAEVLERLVPASPLDDFETAAVHLLKNELETVRDYVRRLETRIRRLEGSADGSGDSESGSDEQSWISAASRGGFWRGSTDPGHPPRSDPRFAVLGTPQSGEAWISGVLAELFDSKEIFVGHPADVDWSRLPRRLVLRMNCSRTVLLADILKYRNVRVVSPARHPFETLVALWETSHTQVSGDKEPAAGAKRVSFVEWALSSDVKHKLSMTASWWSVPSTCRLRFEDIQAGGPAYLRRLLDECGYSAPDGQPSGSVDAPGTPRSSIPAPPGRPTWGELISPVDLPSLWESYESVFSALGYDLPVG